MGFHKKKRTAAAATPEEVPLIDEELLDFPHQLRDNMREILSKRHDVFENLPSSIQKLVLGAKSLLLYKPPVGAMWMFLLYRWIFTSRKFSIIDLAERSEMRMKRRRGRSMDLDAGDRDYNGFGGVEQVRVSLCRVALQEAMRLGSAEEWDKVRLLDGGLSVTCPPHGSRYSCLDRSIEFLVGVQSFMGYNDVTRNKRNEREFLLSTSAKLLELRSLDALLRTLRDRLLASCKRLEKNEQYWRWRVNWYGGNVVVSSMRKWGRRIVLRTTMEEDRNNLSLATALYRKQLERLGLAQKMLLSRPKELKPEALLIPNPDMKDIDYAQAVAMLSSDTNWIPSAHEWTSNTRQLIYQLISNVILSTPHNHAYNDLTLLYQWSTGINNEEDAWRSALSLVDSLPKAALPQRPTKEIVAWFQRIDFQGVPSLIAALTFAHVLHNTITPHWPMIVETIRTSTDVMKGIFNRRFYTPLREIVLDLLNRRPRLLDPFALQIEETSLDNMLKDIKVLPPDVPYDRASALAAAASAYEDELRRGPLMGVLRGNMVRLLLIQIQQLKTDLLIAMGTIDDLVDANRLNVQLLASIPSVLLVYFGSRLFFKMLFSFRSKSLFSSMDVHTKMSDYFFQMEQCLLLSTTATTTTSPKKITEFTDVELLDATKDIKASMAPETMGQFLLVLHKYLLLLDYSTPPVSAKVSDSIHMSMQDLFQQGGEFPPSLQLALLKTIRTKHEELAKLL